MRVKEIDRTANVAWSPSHQHPVYIAAGTAAQQLDATFSTSAALEIFALDLSEPVLDMDLAGSIQSDCRFHKLIWGSYGMNEGSRVSGSLVGGGDNGTVYIWDPAAIIDHREETLLTKLTKHVGPVQALDINPFQTNLLASGASESDIYIWDLNNSTNPMTPGTKSQPLDDVTCLAWNKQVQHILASTYAGRCVVWDLRKNEPIIKVSDSMSRIKCKLIAWHPDVATQMCLASEDDHSPVIQLWDLRFATSPLKSLENHQRGLLSMAWCPSDADLLLSCGKDNRILCWNPNSSAQNGEVVYELPTRNQWSFDVQWCPRNPNLISSSSFDGHVSVYSIMGGTPQGITPSKVADSFPVDPFSQPPPLSPTAESSSCALKRPPKWMRRPVGASFAFGGKLVSFENSKPVSPQQPVQRMVNISQVVTETDLVARSNQLESALSSGQFSEFCAMKVANSENQEDENVWNFLKVNFESDPRTRYLQLLGYDKTDISSKVAELIQDSSEVTQATPGVDPTQLAEKISGLGIDDMAEDSQISEGVSAFEQIASQKAEQDKEMSPLPITTDNDFAGLLTQSLLMADFESAVDVCLHNGHMAEAIIIAVAGGPELLHRTKQHYFTHHSSNLNRLISAVVTSDYERVVRSCKLSSWKEALALTLTYAKGDQFAALCDILGGRLETECDGEMADCASLCYICAGNVDKLVQCWDRNNTQSPHALLECIEKVMVLCRAVEQVRGTSPLSSDMTSLARCLSQYAELLAAQGSLTTAMNYIGDSQQHSLAMLRDRLYHALTSQQAAVYPLPKKPFTATDVLPEGPPPQARPAGVPDNKPTPRQYHQTQAGSFQTTTTPSSTPRPPQSGVSPAPTHLHTSTSYSTGGFVQPAYTAAPVSSAPAVSAYSKGPLSHKYPSYPAPSTGAYDPYTTPAFSQGYGAGGSYYPNASQPGSVSAPQLFDPMTGTAQQHSPGGPASLGSGSSQASYIDRRPDKAWNDTPLIQDRKKSETYQAPAPITAPIMGAAPADQGPPGAPTYPSQIYNPQDYQHQPPPQEPQKVSQPPVKQQEVVAPKEKAPVPEEHQVLCDVLDKLVHSCLDRATNQQMRRKLQDVLRKLDLLTDRLRQNNLSPGVVGGLHQIVSSIQQYDYQGGLACHTQMVSQGNFSEISSFMPGIKMLIQTAANLQVYIQ